MIRSAMLVTCVMGVMGFCTIVQAQPLTNVHQQKQTAAAAKTPDTAKKTEAQAPANQVAEMFTLNKIHCPAGMHYFIGYNPCIPPSPWDQPTQQQQR